MIERVSETTLSLCETGYVTEAERKLGGSRIRSSRRACNPKRDLLFAGSVVDLKAMPSTVTSADRVHAEGHKEAELRYPVVAAGENKLHKLL